MKSTRPGVAAGIIIGVVSLACDAPPRAGAARDEAPARAQATLRADTRFAGVPALVNDTVWRFPSGATVPSRLRAAIEYIGLIDGEGGPYLLASGVECNYCDADLTVLLQPAADSVAYIERDMPGWYVYPGPIRSAGTDSVMLASRLFWGRCLSGRAPGLLQFATEYDSAGAVQRRIVRMAELRDGRVVEDSIVVSPPDTSDVRGPVDAGTCREIPPREQMSGF